MVSTVGRSRCYFYGPSTPDGLITVADGTFTTQEMSMDYTIGNVFFQFYDADGDPVTPTGGTITTEASAFDGQWLMPSNDHVTNANTVLAAPDGVATYTPPTFDSRARFSRIILSGIVGAVFLRAEHWRSIA